MSSLPVADLMLVKKKKRQRYELQMASITVDISIGFKIG